MFSSETGTVSPMPEVWQHRSKESGEACTESQRKRKKEKKRKKRKRKPGAIYSVEETVAMAEPVDKTANRASSKVGCVIVRTLLTLRLWMSLSTPCLAKTLF